MSFKVKPWAGMPVKPAERTWCDVRVQYTLTDRVQRYDEGADALVEEWIESEPKSEVFSLLLTDEEDAADYAAHDALRKTHKLFHVSGCEVIGPSQVRRNHTSSSLFKLPTGAHA